MLKCRQDSGIAGQGLGGLQNWQSLVNRPQGPQRLDELTKSINRGAPFGESNWKMITTSRMNLESTMRTRGQPKKCIGHL